jgi:hypothetical protein
VKNNLNNPKILRVFGRVSSKLNTSATAPDVEESSEVSETQKSQSRVSEYYIREERLDCNCNGEILSIINLFISVF